MKRLIIFLILFFVGTMFSQRLQIPLSQPFNVNPWYYSGTEHVDVIPSNVKDWMLFELRSHPDTIIYRMAGFYCTDGKARNLTATSPIKFSNISGQYYLVCIHRNSLPVMSATKLTLQNGYLINAYDFTTSADKSYGGDKAVTYNNASGKWAFYGGDANRDRVINVLDYKEIYDSLFKVGYIFGDVDNNGVVNVLDYGTVYNNLFKASQIPLGNIYTASKLNIVNAFAKDTSQATTLPWRAYDGVTYTGDASKIWTSNPIPEWIYFQLDQTKHITQLKMSFSYFHNGRIYGYNIQYSNDAINWITAIPSANSIANAEWVYQNVNFNAKYIKINFTSNNQSNWAGFYEVEIYGY